MSLKKIMALAMALLMLSVRVTGQDHWALEFAVNYMNIDNISDLDEYIPEDEFYIILDACTGDESDHGDAEFITREAACAALAKYLTMNPVQCSFTDIEEIKERAALETLYGLGVIDGYPDGSFRPKEPLTRGEAYKIFSRFEELEYVNLDELNYADFDEPDYVINQEPKPAPAPARRNRRTASAGTVEEPENVRPGLTFTAAMGAQFRSIDITITSVVNANDIYYTIVKSGSPRPDKTEILSGANGISGRWVDAEDRREKITFSVTGESGLIDGYNYDIYMMAVEKSDSNDSVGNTSEIMSATSVMAMPFSALNTETGTFTISSLSTDEIDRFYPDLSQNSKNGTFNQTARQFENIQRLADLYANSNGVHGSEEFLRGGYTYVLAEDLDLSDYMARERESGWKPIGTSIPFSGCFEGNNKTISGLYIDMDKEISGVVPEYAGLFGRIKNACIRNLTLNEPIIMARNLVSSETYACVGTVAAESVQSVIERVNIDSPRLTVYSANTDSMCAVGGVVGNGINTDLSHITVTGAEISSNGPGIRDIAGGIAGRYYLNHGGKYLLSDLFISGMLHQQGKAAGGVAGVIDAVTDEQINLFGENIDSLIRVGGRADYAGGIAGNVGYEALLGQRAQITFDNCYASGMIKAAETAGGLFGKVNSPDKASFIVKNSASEADLLAGSDNAVMGGFAGEVHSGSFENCHSVGSGITSFGGDAGGFVGIARGGNNFITCLTNRNVQAAINAGGFIGRQDSGTTRFYNCSSGGRVSGANVVGDFAGSLINDKLAVEIIDCTVKGLASSGQLVGEWR